MQLAPVGQCHPHYLFLSVILNLAPLPALYLNASVPVMWPKKKKNKTNKKQEMDIRWGISKNNATGFPQSSAPRVW